MYGQIIELIGATGSGGASWGPYSAMAPLHSVISEEATAYLAHSNNVVVLPLLSSLYYFVTCVIGPPIF
jgi:hypothetical protein